MIISRSINYLAHARINRKILSTLVTNKCEKSESYPDVKVEWPVERLHMHTQHSQQRPRGAEFSTGFIDTHLTSNEKNKARNILLLCNEADVDDVETRRILQENFMAPLHKHNCRIILPFMPGSQNTSVVDDGGEVCLQRQMLGERTAFIVDFISAANIRRLDMVVGHSFSCFPAFTLASTSPFIKNLFLVNPPPLHTPPQFIKPLKKSFLMVELYERWYGKWLGRRMLNRLRVQMDGYHRGELAADQAIHFIKTLQGIPYVMIDDLASSFNLTSCNLFTVNNDIDGLFERQSLLESLEQLEVKPDNIVLSTDDLKELEGDNQVSELPSSSPPSSSGTSPLRKSMFLSSKEHFIFENKKMTEIVTNEIIEILNKTTKI